MKGNGLERDTIDGVIKAFERVNKRWHSANNQLNYADFRDALWYLKKYKAERERPLGDRLIDVLREVRGEE